MIQSGLTESRIDGLEKLFNVFPRDVSFRGAYLKGVLLHDNGDVQLTYSIKSEKTYIIVFVMSDCEDLTNFRVTAQKIKIEGIDIDVVQNDMLHFVDRSNAIDIVCRGIKIATNVLLSEDFAKEQATKLTQEYSDIIQKKFLDLEKLEPLPNGEPLFRRDDSYHGIHANHHTMYKLRDLRNKDNSIVYEFLIEFDRNNPSLGIYYGCKALIKKGDNLEQQISLQNEWNDIIKDEVKEKLNNLFPDKKFDNRFKPTDNANDNTFWPFWISLHEDENIVEVAVRAMIVIRNEYKRFLEGKKYTADDTCNYRVKAVLKGKKDEIHSQSRFTEESWKELRRPWKDTKGKINPYLEKLNEKWAELLDKFIARAVENGIVTENVDGYEKALMYHVTTTEFSLMLRLLMNRLPDEKSVPWTLICRQFLDKNGKTVSEDTIKKSCERHLKIHLSDYFNCETNAERIKWEEGKKDKSVVKFRKLMN